MIALTSQPFLVDADGATHPFDPDALARELEAACTETGVDAKMAVPQLLLAAEDFLLTGTDGPHAGEAMRRSELDQTLATALRNVGYADVAAAYLRLRHLPVGASLAEPLATAWSRSRVQVLLATQMTAATTPPSVLAPQVVALLERLAFQEVTDALVLELAAHLLREPAAPPVMADDASPWLLEPDYWIGTLSRENAALCASGILVPSPVSRLLPTARMSLDLAALAGQQADTPLTELLFFPQVRQSARAARRLLLAMREAIGEHVELTPEMPVRLNVIGFSSLLQTRWTPTSRADTRRLHAELRDLIRVSVSDGLGCPLLLDMPGNA